MNWLNALILALGLSIAVPAVAARAPLPVMNVEHQAVVGSDGLPLTQEQVKMAIVAAAAAKGWSLQPQADGSFLATLDVRGGKHQAQVAISYSDKDFSIVYRNSVNLNVVVKEAGKSYGGVADQAADGTTLIHPNYNNWVNGLAQAIKTSTQAMSSK